MTWFSNVGDGRGGIWCGDAFKIVDELVRLKGGPIADVVITDPPFGESTVKGARTGTTNPGDPQRKLIAGDRQYAAWSPAQTLAYCELMGRAARRWVIVFTDYHYWPWLDGTIGTVPGLQWVRAGVWLKPNGTPQLTGDRPAHSFEAIAIMHAAGSRLRWNGGGGRAEWDMRTEADEPDMPVAWRVPVDVAVGVLIAPDGRFTCLTRYTRVAPTGILESEPQRGVVEDMPPPRGSWGQSPQRGGLGDVIPPFLSKGEAN